VGTENVLRACGDKRFHNDAKRGPLEWGSGMRFKFLAFALAAILLGISARWTGGHEPGLPPGGPSAAVVSEPSPEDNTPKLPPVDRFKAIVEKLEDEGKLPKLDRTDSVAGIDADGNGVRDDLDAYIAKRFTEPSERAAVIQYAQSYQAYLLTDPEDIDALGKAFQMLQAASACVHHRFDEWWDTGGPKSPFVINADISQLTLNTRKRLLTSVQLSQAMSGMSWSHISGDTCEK